MVAGALLWRVPDRDATLDAFISPDAEETDETDDVEELAGATSDEEQKGADGEQKGADDKPAETDEEPAGTQEADAAEEQESDAGGEEPITELAETTFAWSPEGAGCAACGEQTRRRWRTDAGFVCHGCVDWERAREQ